MSCWRNFEPTLSIQFVVFFTISSGNFPLLIILCQNQSFKIQCTRTIRVRTIKYGNLINKYNEFTMLNFIQILIKMANISSARMTFLVGGFGLEIEICLNFNGFLFDATCFCFVIHFWFFFLNTIKCSELRYIVHVHMHTLQ